MTEEAEMSPSSPNIEEKNGEEALHQIESEPRHDKSAKKYL